MNQKVIFSVIFLLLSAVLPIAISKILNFPSSVNQTAAVLGTNDIDSVEATVTEIIPIDASVKTGRGTTRQAAIITYEFFVDSKAYNLSSTIDTINTKLSVGDKVSVHYNASNPNISTIEGDIGASVIMADKNEANTLLSTVYYILSLFLLALGFGHFVSITSETANNNNNYTNQQILD